MGTFVFSQALAGNSNSAKSILNAAVFIEGDKVCVQEPGKNKQCTPSLTGKTGPVGPQGPQGIQGPTGSSEGNVNPSESSTFSGEDLTNVPILGGIPKIVMVTVVKENAACPTSPWLDTCISPSPGAYSLPMPPTIGKTTSSGTFTYVNTDSIEGGFIVFRRNSSCLKVTKVQIFY